MSDLDINVDEPEVCECPQTQEPEDDIFLDEPKIVEDDDNGASEFDNGSMSPTFRDPMSPSATFNSRAESIVARPKLGSRLESEDPFLSSTRSTPNSFMHEGGSPLAFNGSPEPIRATGTMSETWTPSASPEPSAVKAKSLFPVQTARPALKVAANAPRIYPKGKATELSKHCTSLKLIPPQIIKPSFVKELVARDLPDPLKAKHKLLPALPTELLVPMALRCDFCVKFDSVCSKCHFRFKSIVESRQSVLMKNIGSLTGERPVSILFNTILNGNEDFLQALVGRIPKSNTWTASVPTTPITQYGDSKDLGGGRQFGTHVACGFDCPRMAKILLSGGFRFQRSEARLVPSELLTTINEAWEDALSSSTEYKEHQMAETAKDLRRVGNFDEATKVYADLLETNPRNEKAYLGMAKMLFDQKKFTDCLEQCKLILERYDEIIWVDFRKSTIIELSRKATDGIHTHFHSQPGSALKECGCIIVDNIVVSLRKVPFPLVKKILEFCDCVSLWGMWRSIKSPLLQDQVTSFGASLCDVSVGEMLSREFGYEEMYEAIKMDPVKNGSQSVLIHPLRFIGLQVMAMADFHTFIIKSSVVGENPNLKEPDTSVFFRKPRDPIEKLKRVVATKEYRVNRAGCGKAWDVHDAGEWEIDLEASEALVEAIQRRLQDKK